MLIPYSTDAPVYHVPVATIGLIAASVGTFCWQVGAGDAAWAGWQQHFGGGLHPLQWITCHFVQYGPMHLIGNMVFLWTFGLVVEGKLGWPRFLLLWAVLAAGGAAVLQALAAVLGISGTVAGGASLYVFGLMAVACVWAPLNEVDCLVLLPRPIGGMVSLALWKLGALYIGWNAFLTWWKGTEAFGAVAHLVGAAVGTVVGVQMVRNGEVDCEGWDALTLIFGARSGGGVKATSGGGRTGPLRPPRRHDEVPPPVRTATWSLTGDAQRASSGGGSPPERLEGRPEPMSEEPPIAAVEDAVQPDQPDQPLRLRFREALKTGQWERAWALYQQLREDNPSFQLNAGELMRLAEALYHRREWNRAVPLMQELIARFPERSDPTRIALADVTLRVLRRPAAARKLLQSIDRERLPEPLRERFDRLNRAVGEAGP